MTTANSIDEYIADAEWSMYGYTLKGLAGLLLGEGFSEKEVLDWIEQNGESFLEYFSSEA